MCGILGQIRFRDEVDEGLLVRQRDTMRHRGPDSAGVWVSDDRRVGFAHRRLAIIDLSPGGHQPMIDPHTQNAITFNGEIYNFRELRRELEKDGANFSSQSDTEVILAAYRRWGRDCIRRLDGMFALALYDATTQRVLLARDRAGEKPLYFASSGASLSFASELKALLADPQVPRTASLEAVNEYLAYGFSSAPLSMLAGVRKLPAGSLLEINLASGATTESRYWDIPLPSASANERSLDELVDELHRVLQHAVRGQLLADVPVGVLLSGGVDSSIIASIAASVLSGKVRTFTARFPGHADVDEGPFARMVADHIGSEHIELEVPAASEEVLRSLVVQFDDPIADSSLVPTFLLSREIRRHATVAIGGDGGDELFGGYRHYPNQLRWSHRRDRLPSGIGRLVAALAVAILPEDTRGMNSIRALGASDAEIVAGSGHLFRSGTRRELIGDRISAAIVSRAERQRAELTRGRDGIIDRSTVADFRGYMVDDVLVKVDRASMLTSLEVRAPFLDRSVIEFAFGAVPSAGKVTSTDRKILLRRLGNRLLPTALDLRRKQGFDIPLSSWLWGAWRPVVEELRSFQSSLLHSNPVPQLLERSRTSAIAAEQLFAVMMLFLWEQQYAIRGSQ